MICGKFIMLAGRLFYEITGPKVYKRFPVFYDKEHDYARIAAMAAINVNRG